MKINKQKEYSKKHLLIIVFIIGIFFLTLGFSGAFILKNANIGFIGMFIGSVLMIPSSWKFYINNRKDEDSGIFWFVWFLTLPLLVIVCLIYFYKAWIYPWFIGWAR